MTELPYNWFVETPNGSMLGTYYAHMVRWLWVQVQQRYNVVTSSWIPAVDKIETKMLQCYC